MSLISYFGSKSSNDFINHLINPNIPKDGVKTYVEPFSGSFATYMDDPSLKFENVIFNDRNRHQVNLYRCASEPSKLLEYILGILSPGGILYTVETDPLKKWDFYKSVYREYTKNYFLDDMSFDIGDFEKATIYAFLITSSFSSVYPRGGGFSGYIKKNDRLKLEILIDKLKKDKYTDKLKSITEFNNIDFEELINKYDSEDTYMYLDPPYFDPNDKRLFWYGSEEAGVFGKLSHERLANLIKNCKSRWALSYYYFPQLLEWFPKDKYIWMSREVNRRSAGGGNNSHTKSKINAKGTELLILNYDTSTGIKLP